ncbi:hypothetical protein D3C83_310440 [compost metagenome]
MLKRDQTGKQQISIETEPAFNITGNRLVGMNCIHSNVDARTKAGQTCHFKTVVKFENL